MKISTLLNAVKTALDAQATPLGGAVELFITPADALQKLRAKPRAWKLLIGWDGGAESSGGADSLSLQLIIQAPAGLELPQGGDAADGRPGDVALLDRVDMVTQWMCGMRFYYGEKPHPMLDCVGFTYASVRWLGDPEQLTPTRDVLLTFRIRRSLPWAEELPVTLPTQE